MCVVCIGGGARGGGGLGWKNNIPVTPGASVTVVVGVGGDSNGSAAGDSYFQSPAIVKGGAANQNAGGTYVGDGGGNGGTATTGANAESWGGGGAGGYSGNGGNGGFFGSPAGGDGSGGGGGGGAEGLPNINGNRAGGSGGGGTGILGQGASGNGGLGVTQTYTSPGGGGSGGNAGEAGGYVDAYPGGVGGNGGSYGGGGGYGVIDGIRNGAAGAVRIIWGAQRAFPSTNTGNL